MDVEREQAGQDDARIDTDVRETLRWDMRIDDANLDVAVQDGSVRLLGRVASLAEKLEAEADVKRIRGVRGIENQIAVEPQVLRTDLDIARDVQNSLVRDHRVDELAVMVDVQDGVVRLRGSVATLAEQRAAAEDAWYTPGIVEVINEIEVVPPESRSDAAIEDDVRAALRLSGQVQRAESIEPLVRQGVVYLRGAVARDLERHAAEEAARMVSGVTAVVDDLVVVPARGG